MKSTQLAAQNCSAKGFGAFTGEISPLHLKDMGINWVILGHSQRRTLFGEADAHIAQKIANALKEGIKVIACFGELLEQREGGHTFQVLQKQLNAFLDVCKGHWK